MASFALITEGLTDQTALKNLIHGMIEDKDDEEVHFNILQPALDTTDQSRQGFESWGGWEKVLDFCTQTTELLKALSTNQYLVIQIDTDTCEHANFGLCLNTEPSQLVTQTKEILIKKLTEDFYSTYKDRIIFAITVHSTECWLLTFYGSQNSSRKKIVGCEQKLNNELNLINTPYNKDVTHYEKICKPLRKYKNISRMRINNDSLEDFLKSLETLAPYSHKTGTSL